MTEKEENSFVMDILKKAFPDRKEEQIAPIGLLYVGMRWGRDWRYADVPDDEHGAPLNGCSSQEEYAQYLDWLAEYLTTLEATPNEEQQGLCTYIEKMIPEDAIQMVAMNAALYDGEMEFLEMWLEDGYSCEVCFENMKENAGEEGGALNEESFRDMYAKVQSEVEEKEEYAANVRHSDVSYRVPLSVILKKVDSQEKALALVRRYFDIYNEYAQK
ncbi:hypothetical protein JWG39_09760 [Desulforhopalus vacuolatus]|uniref:hypothetical protein n=1 Tax=Desulforhopalus vacuolatus TaxID=40414 RepID=UPI00196684A3|nr:hypothetical protein [Desulforhopalus vacuolatus]MBM9520099.1 hypothetical protein [Desulforhopalus vacuolatus]